jgi:hypothetical protein
MVAEESSIANPQKVEKLMKNGTKLSMQHCFLHKQPMN